MTKIRKQCPLLSKITFCTKFKHNVERINMFARTQYCDVGKLYDFVKPIKLDVTTGSNYIYIYTIFDIIVSIKRFSEICTIREKNIVSKNLIASISQKRLFLDFSQQWQLLVSSLLEWTRFNKKQPYVRCRGKVFDEI